MFSLVPLAQLSAGLTETPTKQISERPDAPPHGWAQCHSTVAPPHLISGQPSFPSDHGRETPSLGNSNSQPLHWPTYQYLLQLSQVVDASFGAVRIFREPVFCGKPHCTLSMCMCVCVCGGGQGLGTFLQVEAPSSFEDYAACRLGRGRAHWSRFGRSPPWATLEESRRKQNGL